MFGCHSVVKVKDLLGPDCNSNFDPNYKPEDYSATARRTFKLPNVVTQILNDAAKESNLSPFPRRSIAVSPLTLPAQTVQPKGLVERRWERIQASNGIVKSSYAGNDFSREQFPSSSTSSTCKFQEDVDICKLSPNSALSNQEKPVKKPLFINEFVNVPGALKSRNKVPTKVDWKGWTVSDSEEYALLIRKKYQVYKPEPNKCCCERPTKTVWCRMCGFHVRGNVKTVCPLHPKMIYLHAWEICGNEKCKAPRLLTEISLD